MIRMQAPLRRILDVFLRGVIRCILTLEIRLRQFRDVKMSCGNQPTGNRVPIVDLVACTGIIGYEWFPNDTISLQRRVNA